MVDAVWILRLWSLMYALEVVLYLHSAESVQERVLIDGSSAKFNLLSNVFFVNSLSVSF